MGTTKIRVLPEDVICRIAAGEVVERPASVVKELLENSIDANASKIEIEIKDGGQKLIEITDNGEGMCRQDAILAMTPHATSKIQSDTDLNSINSLGFRGEALPTIASVSRLTLVTKHEEDDIGTKLQVDGGKITASEKTNFPGGTRIQVKNLFYNVPARRKFLKSVRSEMAQISDIVCHYMMGYPEIAFKFSKSNIKLAHTNGSGDLLDAILAVYGPELARNLVPLKGNAGNGVFIKGFISPPNEARSSSRYMTTLINRRYVKTKLISQAISKAISAFFPRGRYPVLVLDLRLPPSMIDVNVHPQKTEIRFKDERWMFGIIAETIQKSLSGLRMVAPVVSNSDIKLSNQVGQRENQAQNILSPSFSVDTGEAIQQPDGLVALPENISMFPRSVAKEKTSQTDNFETTQSMPNKIYELKSNFFPNIENRSASSLSPVRSLKSPTILAQLKNSYLLGEDEDGLFIVDQHAAHERILFDQYTETYSTNLISSQPLLFPVPLKLLPSERMIVKDKLAELRELGFSIQQEEDGQFYATAIPIPDRKTSDEQSIQDVLSQILNDWESRSKDEIKADLLKMMACKAAVKAGDPLSESEWKSLLAQLLKTENPFTCPHGRPIVIRLTTKQIENGFLRT